MFIMSEQLPTPQRWRRVSAIIGLVVLLVGVFTGGYALGRQRGLQAGLGAGAVLDKAMPPPAYLSRDVDFKLFWDVWSTLQQKYVDRPVADTKLFYGALQGLVAGVGDPYTTFFDPQTAKEFNQELSGSFEGIGAEIGIRNNQIVVIAPLADTPAERAGLKAGDAILVIDGRDTAGLALDAAVAAIRGPQGTAVKLLLRRATVAQPFEVAIVREKIAIQSVEFSMKATPGSEKPDIAYIKISHFNEDTVGAFNIVVDQALRQSPRGLILDLRNNPGGFLETAVEVASHWVSNGPIVTQQSGSGENAPYQAQGKASFKGLKTVVLVNAGSASASEIVAGALQDYGVATLVGEKTFGKGSVQELQELPDGSALKVTIAKWLTPQGRSINGAGITPDVEVKVDQTSLPPGDDPELARGLELLK